MIFWSIKNFCKLRYIFEAKPTGTFWYHSHVGEQRVIGLFGALIVKEIPAPVFPGIDVFEDKPEEHTLVFLDFERKNPSDFGYKNGQSPKMTGGGKVRDTCYPDGSKVPKGQQFASPYLNRIDLPENAAKAERRRRSTNPSNPQLSTFSVQKGKTYRFRLVGAMRASAYRFSIDDHKLIVIATDGYLVEPFETDYIIIHSGERYDFLLHATQKNSARWYLMRIETLAIDCISKERLKNSGLALLGYDNSSYDEFLANCNSLGENPRECNETAPCTVMNCPFEAYAKGVGLDCHHVNELKLLYETPARDIPDSENIILERTWFFDFERRDGIATVNDKQFEFPHIALQVSNYSGKIKECSYDEQCSSTEDTNQCVQIVDIPDEYFKTSMRFVLSSLGDFMHPIHLHGHSFHVVKIGYPTYFENGTIDKPTQDLQDSECGHPSWKHDCAPGNIKANRTTVRKDTIMVPAGGYVVIEFRADNPGYWFMHCHIDPHLEMGMAAVIRELKGYQNLPPPANLTVINKDFCWTVDEFKEQKYSSDPCNATSDNPAKSAEPHSIERQVELAKQRINRRKNLDSIIQKDEVLKNQPVKSKNYYNPRTNGRTDGRTDKRTNGGREGSIGRGKNITFCTK